MVDELVVCSYETRCGTTEHGHAHFVATAPGCCSLRTFQCKERHATHNSPTTAYSSEPTTTAASTAAIHHPAVTRHHPRNTPPSLIHTQPLPNILSTALLHLSSCLVFPSPQPHHPPTTMFVLSFHLAALLVLSLLLLSSVALVRAQAQLCSTVLGDSVAVDYPMSAPFQSNVVLLQSFMSGPVAQPINQLATLAQAQANNAQVLLGLYADDASLIAATGPIFATGSATGTYAAPFANGQTVTLKANTLYYIAFLPSAQIQIRYKFSGATTSPAKSFNNPYSSGLHSSYPGTPYQSSDVYGVAALLCPTTASGGGDPLFTGFYGQQFYISGVDGQVMTVLASHNMQVNGRLVQLEDGQSMLPYEQDKLRQASELRLSDDPTAPAALPSTIAWTHPGTYFGECGVALFDHNRLHAKAGGYATGWAALTLNRRPLPVSDVPIVIGQGANTTYIHRSSSHHLTIRTATLQLTLVNSDHFLNIERVQLESGYDAKTRLGGILGGTADASWSWAPAVEADNTVASGDLFDRQQMDM